MTWPVFPEVVRALDPRDWLRHEEGIVAHNAEDCIEEKAPDCLHKLLHLEDEVSSSAEAPDICINSFYSETSLLADI